MPRPIQTLCHRGRNQSKKPKILAQMLLGNGKFYMIWLALLAARSPAKMPCDFKTYHLPGGDCRPRLELGRNCEFTGLMRRQINRVKLAFIFCCLVLACSGCASVQMSHWDDPPPNMWTGKDLIFQPGDSYGSITYGKW